MSFIHRTTPQPVTLCGYQMTFCTNSQTFGTSIFGKVHLYSIQNVLNRISEKIKNRTKIHLTSKLKKIKTTFLLHLLQWIRLRSFLIRQKRRKCRFISEVTKASERSSPDSWDINERFFAFLSLQNLSFAD